ncbi:MAG: hypothetical protein QE164_07905 [Candidatus Nezhaarchaeota archaeon]|nr:hypothetical protein [Candidatus Nezhaarchaeota archaeon]
MVVNLDVARSTKEMVEVMVTVEGPLISKSEGDDILTKLKLACLIFSELIPYY